MALPSGTEAHCSFSGILENTEVRHAPALAGRHVPLLKREKEGAQEGTLLSRIPV